MSSDIKTDNDSNLIISLNVDSVEFNGVVFKKGNMIQNGILPGRPFELKYFNIHINKSETSSVIVLGGDKVNINLEYAIKI